MLIEDATTTRLTLLVDQLLEEARRAEIVDRDVALDGVHALADADLRREVHDLVDILEGAFKRRFVPDVADDQFGIRREVGRRLAAGMHLIDEAVEDPDPVALLEQGLS